MRPPAGVRLVMEAVCIMQGIKPKKVAGEQLGTKVDDYWEPGKALLQDPGRVSLLKFKFQKISNRKFFIFDHFYQLILIFSFWILFLSMIKKIFLIPRSPKFNHTLIMKSLCLVQLQEFQKLVPQFVSGLGLCISQYQILW